MGKGISKQDLAMVKELDLFTYFKNYEPQELIRYSRNEYGQRRIHHFVCPMVYGHHGQIVSVEEVH